MESLREILLSGNGGVISLVGAGGKTSLMFRIAREVSNAGESVLTTTTTRIMWPDKKQSSEIFLAATPKLVLEKASVLMKNNLHLTAASARVADGEKLVGFESAAIDELQRSGRFRWIVVEADGAANKWIKVPAAHEPVIPKCTDRLIGVVGLKAVGKPLTAQWVFRPEHYSKLTGLEPGMPVTVESVATSILDPEGILKGAPPQATRYIFLNLAGDMRLLERGRQLARRLCRHGRRSNLKRVIIGHARDNPAVLECFKIQ